MNHGTDTRYWTGCRCFRCAVAHSRAQADYRRRKAAGLVTPRDRRSREPKAETASPHGTVSCYTNDGCGCAECLAAWRERQRRYRERAMRTGRTTVDAAPVRTLVLRAQLSGYGSPRIARGAGVSAGAVKLIARGVTKRVGHDNARRIAAAGRALIAAGDGGSHKARRTAWEAVS